MVKGDALGDRMKRYEQAFVSRLPRRMPSILRVDGKAFHTLTRNCVRPFDAVLMAAMDSVAMALCKEVQGAQLAYVQSDEVSVLLHDYKRLDTDPWFDKKVQKMVSVAASIATASFNDFVRREVNEAHENAPRGIAHFDARVFVLPEAEVCNYFVWRQQDATRNSIQMLARAFYSHEECFEKNGPELQEMCFEKGVNWNDLPTSQKRGRCVVPLYVGSDRSGWSVDGETPAFTSNRKYVDDYLAVEEEGEGR